MKECSDYLKGINNLPGIRNLLEKGSNAAAQKNACPAGGLMENTRVGGTASSRNGSNRP